ncbi:hypothetical protein SAMN06297144_2143 [Sphingomonas guangdongensis]|uniref:CDP-Glycerol:Poly(Glycerophosphate) glycerophosphotransferase n=1 Tax=Sphingomonas guangdongensis TaxID=1141890 RepID=A0A285QYL9_9SPHN|nr:hypothetical protein [Sphingomonas guangdongensis]SOB87023.1 hypothetical protein SAMN06297144_2143 [Sphingomonas guangdongensis]
MARQRSVRVRADVAFLFLGETLLIPHLFPIVEALTAADPDVAVDCWVGAAVNEALIAPWIAPLPRVRLRRAPGFAQRGMPAKLPMLARLAPYLARVPVAVCAEQTSLWLPRVLPWLPTRFVKTSHGVGSMSARDDPRRRAAFHTLVPSQQERATYLARGMPAERIVATGYVKADFRHRTPVRRLFADDRPILLYTPHWQPHRSSWPTWGAEIVAMLAAQDRWNVILAPHQRLVERAPEVRQVLARAAALPHIHADLDSFATVDGSYTAAADLYLGDTSSQVIEFLMTPRPVVFLDPLNRDWRHDPSLSMWAAGQVVTALDDVLPAVNRAPDLHRTYRGAQAEIASDALGDVSGAGAARAAAEVLRVLAMARTRR